MREDNLLLFRYYDETVLSMARIVAWRVTNLKRLVLQMKTVASMI